MQGKESSERRHVMYQLQEANIAFQKLRLWVLGHMKDLTQRNHFQLRLVSFLTLATFSWLQLYNKIWTWFQCLCGVHIVVTPIHLPHFSLLWCTLTFIRQSEATAWQTSRLLSDTLEYGGNFLLPQLISSTLTGGQDCCWDNVLPSHVGNEEV